MPVDPHENRGLACFLAIVARHARDADDFAELADMVIPFKTSEVARKLLYKRLLEEDAAAPHSAMMAAWEACRPQSHWSDEKIMVPALTAAGLAYARAGGQLSSNTLLELLIPGRYELAGRAMQRLRGRLTVIGEETSQSPSRKGALVKVYAMR